MGIWVNVFCRTPVDALRPADLVRGIERRLAVMTYLLRPAEEEEPAAVARRLDVESMSPGEPLRLLKIRYQVDRDRALVAERWTDPGLVAEDVQDLLGKIEASRETAARSIRDHLRGAVETVGIELKAGDARGMGWPVAISAAAEIAERGDGIIHAEGLGWVLPSGNEVDMVLPD